MAVVLLVSGCASFKTSDCAAERAELRATDRAIAQATRQHRDGFSARLASRGHASYHCASGRSGQVRCTKAPYAGHGASLSELHHKRDASLARIARLCR
ncbi:hypothetical protein J1C52_05140 [Roseibaca sp. Y0-43]|nr:hypothetical protein [Roseibaca sp. Y0-43]